MSMHHIHAGILRVQKQTPVTGILVYTVKMSLCLRCLLVGLIKSYMANS